VKPAVRRFCCGAIAFVGGLALAWTFWFQPSADEPRLAGRRIGEFFPRWEKPGVAVQRLTLPESAEPEAALNGLLWMLRHEDEVWLPHYRSFYLRAPIAFRSWLAWPRPARERQTQAFEALQVLVEQPENARRLCDRLADVAPDWLPETAALLSRRDLEAQVVARLATLSTSADSQQRNAAQAALEQHRKPGGLTAKPSHQGGSGRERFF
jgi:hypothetical protein